MFDSLTRIHSGRRTRRESSWDTTGRNADRWLIGPGGSRVLADLKGPGRITHIWMTQWAGYRQCLLKITWDNAPASWLPGSTCRHGLRIRGASMLTPMPASCHG